MGLLSPLERAQVLPAEIASSVGSALEAVPAGFSSAFGEFVREGANNFVWFAKLAQKPPCTSEFSWPVSIPDVCEYESKLRVACTYLRSEAADSLSSEHANLWTKMLCLPHVSKVVVAHHDLAHAVKGRGDVQKSSGIESVARCHGGRRGGSKPSAGACRCAGA